MEEYVVGYFGDERLKKSGEFFSRMMLEKQTVCLRQLGGNRAGEMKLGRWLSNEQVIHHELIENITLKGIASTKGRHILAIQDTTEINYQAHAGRITGGLGSVGNGKDLGFFMHPMLLVDAELETCLGLGSIKTWVRTTQARVDYPKQLIEEKESFRWLEAAEQTKNNLTEVAKLTIIADRESDIYEEWDRIPDQKTYMITRCCRDRKLSTGTKLYSYVKNLEISGVYEFEVKARAGKRSAHKARLEIRFGEIEIKRPKSCSDKNAAKSVKLYVVDVKECEDTVVGNEEPIHWCLLTTHEVKTKEDALQIVKWYCLRWNIEQLFRTLKKQGLDIESSQVENGESLIKLGLLALFIAVKTMQLTMARSGKEQPVTAVFNEIECKVLSAVLPKLEGKTKKQKNPHQVGQLSWASWIIGRLGGWKGYKSESPPGPITMLRGLKKFQSLLEGYLLAELCA